MHSKQWHIDEITRMILEMDTEIKRTKAKFFDLPDFVLDLKIDILREAHSWIVSLFDGPFAEIAEVKKLLTPETWAYYEMFPEECGELVESKMLAEARKAFRVVVYSKRPTLFKKTELKNVRKQGNQSSKRTGKNECKTVCNGGDAG